MADEERIRLILDLGNSGKNAAEVRQELERLDAAADKAGTGFEKMEQSTTKATKGTANLGRSALETGRIVQDFAQGGLGGIINNLEGFTQAIGLGAGAAGAMTLLGVAALTAAPAVKSLWRAFVDGSNDVPKSTDSLMRLNEELETSKKRLGELKDKQTLTNAELAEFNKLTVESTRLEKESNAEKERRNTLDAERKAEAAGNAESIDIVKAATREAGGVDKVVDELTRQMQADSPELDKLYAKLDELEKKQARRKKDDPFNLSGEGFYQADIDLANKAIDKAQASIRPGAEDVVARALKGDQGAINDLAGRFPGGSFGQATPEAIRAQNDEVDASDAQGARLHRAGAARGEVRAEGRDRDKQIDAFNRRNDDARIKGGDLADKDRQKAIADAMRAARNIVRDKPEMLKPQPLMDLIPEGADDDVRARAEAEQGMVARMQTLIGINNMRALATRRFVAGVDNLKVILDPGDM